MTHAQVSAHSAHVAKLPRAISGHTPAPRTLSCRSVQKAHCLPGTPRRALWAPLCGSCLPLCLAHACSTRLAQFDCVLPGCRTTSRYAASLWACSPLVGISIKPRPPRWWRPGLCNAGAAGGCRQATSTECQAGASTYPPASSRNPPPPIHMRTPHLHPALARDAGILADFIGRRWGSRIVASIMLTGALMLTFTPLVPDAAAYFAFFLFALTWYGFGVGECAKRCLQMHHMACKCIPS